MEKEAKNVEPITHSSVEAIKKETAPQEDNTKSNEGITPGKEYSIIDAIKLSRENSRERKFSQTWDLMINLKGIDLKKPENRFSGEAILPKGRGKEPKIAAFVDLMEKEVKEHVNLVIHKDEIAKLAKDKRRMRKIANEHDFFFAEVTLMSEIGKSLGTVLGPRGKVPKPLPPKGNVALLLKSPKNMIRVVLKETPVVHAIAGSQDMSDEDIAENVKTIFNFVKDRLPKGINNIRTTMIKLTMGRPVKIGMK